MVVNDSYQSLILMTVNSVTDQFLPQECLAAHSAFSLSKLTIVHVGLQVAVSHFLAAFGVSALHLDVGYNSADRLGLIGLERRRVA